MKEVEEIPDLILYRPLAFLFVKAIYRTPLTPNNVSFAAVIAGILAGICFSTGNPSYFKAGAAMYLLFNILDCSDGQLARVKKMYSPLGKIVDGIADYASTLAVYLGIAFGYSLRSEKALLWTILLLMAGISNIIHGILVDYYRNRFLDYVREGKSTYETEIENQRKGYEQLRMNRGNIFLRAFLWIYFKYITVQKTLLHRKKQPVILNITPAEYYKKNKLLIRLWLLIGPTIQVTVLIVCSYINRFDIFIWIVLAAFNSLAAVLWGIQRLTDRKYSA